MKLYLDTSIPQCILKLDANVYTWDAGRDLAAGLLKFISDKLSENHSDWQGITEISFMSGPGSFTGLRIGAAVVNTIASELNIPLFDHLGNKHQVIIPAYGRPANITPPRH